MNNVPLFSTITLAFIQLFLLLSVPVETEAVLT